MSFVSLADRMPNSNILAGPIVRRVTKDSVTVWLATSADLKVKLEVYEGDAKLFSKDVASLPKIGPQLFLGCVTAKAAPGQAPLAAGKIYHYNLLFGDGEVPLKDLAPEVLFTGETRPSFCFPAKKDKLVVATGSCRKPHGPGKDAMTLLEKQIGNNLNNPASRPQLLLLTGDQIYADDVAGALLHMIVDAETVLVGGPGEQLPDLGAARELLPTLRGDLADPESGFLTSTAASSHLVGLHEFLLMYIYAWSPLLWSKTAEVLFPTYTETTGKSDTAEVGYYGVDGYTEQGFLTNDACTFKEELDELETFFEALPQVRRALAHVSTLMMFDDHEVTDDWYINGSWSKTVLDSEPGRRLLANGLTAFALCQAWGNTPEAFEAGQWGSELLGTLGTGPDDAFAGADQRDALLLPPRAAPFQGNGTLNTPTSVPARSRWSFDISYDDFHLIALDTRTSRRFPDVESIAIDSIAVDAYAFPQLISPDQLPNQIPDFSSQLVIALFPPPFVGWPSVEYFQSRAEKRDRIEKDCEGPGLDNTFFEAMVATLARKAPVVAGVRTAKVALLSGDVHFAYATRLRYRSGRSYQESPPLKNSKLVVFCMTASACKNHPLTYQRVLLDLSSGKHLFHVLGTNTRADLDDAIRDELRKDEVRNAIAYSKIIGRSQKLEGGGLVVDATGVSDAEREAMNAQWEYQLRFLADPPNHVGLAPPVGPAPAPPRFVAHDNNIGILTLSDTEALFELQTFRLIGGAEETVRFKGSLAVNDP